MTSPPDHLWTYKTKPPHKHRIEKWDLDLPTGHRYGYKRRSDRYHPRYVEFKFYCMCGWSTDGWWGSRIQAWRMADKNHLAPLKQQGRLFT